MADKTIDIRWRDLDAYGHVNQALYVTYAEEVLDAWLRRKLDLPPAAVWDYVAAKTTIHYRTELRLEDRQVIGSVDTVELGTKSVTAAVSLRAPDGRLAAELELVVVVIDGKGGPSRPLTEEERAALAT